MTTTPISDIENSGSSFREKIIRDINEDLDNLTDHELTKVYKFIRTKIIANIKN